MEAQNVFEMIPKEDFHYEPAFTVELSREDLNKIRLEALRLPQFEGHTQCVERLIRRATEASSNIWSKESRDLRIRTQQQVSKHLQNVRFDKRGFQDFVGSSSLLKSKSV